MLLSSPERNNFMVNPKSIEHKSFVREQADEILNVVARVKATPNDGGIYNLRGSIKREGVKLTDIGDIRKDAPNRSAAELKASEMLTKLLNDYRKANRKVVERKSTGRTAKNTIIENNQIISAFNAVKNMETVNNWGPRTTRSMVKWFERNFLTFLSDIIASEMPFEKSIVVDHIISVESKNTDLDFNLPKNVRKYLRVTQIIYNCMRSVDSSLPIFIWHEGDDIVYTMEENCGYELMKYLRTNVHLSFREKVENEISVNPYIARAAAIQDSCGARTGEAAAIQSSEIIDYDTFLCIKICYQDDDSGGRTNVLKTPNSYRYVVMDEWGESVVRRCNNVIRDLDNSDEYRVKESELSKWVKTMLVSAGLTPEEIEAWRSDMLLEVETPGRKVEKDVTAYILRRNRCTMWDHICGYTSEELDAQMGHVYEKNRDWTSSEVLQKLSRKAKLFNLGVETNGGISLSAGSSYVLSPARLVQFEATEAMSVSITMNSLASGDSIRIVTNGKVEYLEETSYRDTLFDGNNIIITVDDLVEWEGADGKK